MSISRADVGPNLRDTQLAIALAFGLSDEIAGKRVCTPEAPAGVAARTVYNRKNTNGPYIKAITTFVANLRRELEVESKEISKAQIRDAMEKELGTAWAAIVNAIKSGDVDSAWRLVEHQFGKPSQVHKHEGDVNVNHRIWGQPQPQTTLEQQDRDIEDSSHLLSAIPADVLDAEVIPS